MSWGITFLSLLAFRRKKMPSWKNFKEICYCWVFGAINLVLPQPLTWGRISWRLRFYHIIELQEQSGDPELLPGHATRGASALRAKQSQSTQSQIPFSKSDSSPLGTCALPGNDVFQFYLVTFYWNVVSIFTRKLIYSFTFILYCLYQVLSLKTTWHDEINCRTIFSVRGN